MITLRTNTVDVAGTPEVIQITFAVGERFTLDRENAVALARAILGSYGEGLTAVVRDGELWEDLDGKEWFIANGSAIPYGQGHKTFASVMLTQSVQQRFVKNEGIRQHLPHPQQRDRAVRGQVHHLRPAVYWTKGLADGAINRTREPPLPKLEAVEVGLAF